jgi:SAM-dependent methyltransferase
MAATIPAGGPAYAIYEATAPVYDVVTAHHRHDLWTDMVERLLGPHGLPARGTLLDVGCGTGKSFLPWEARGWSVVACDASPGMLERAAAKAGPATRTLLADARDLPTLGRFDLVAMVDDVVNYVTADEHPAVFAGVRRNLAPGGLFVLDTPTLLTYRTFFAATEVHDVDGRFVVWRGETPADFAPGGTAEAMLDTFVRDPDGRWDRRRVRHRQHHHSIEPLEARLREAGLRVCAVHGVDDECRTAPLDELRHSKAVVVATRAER